MMNGWLTYYVKVQLRCHLDFLLAIEKNYSGETLKNRPLVLCPSDSSARCVTDCNFPLSCVSGRSSEFWRCANEWGFVI